MTISVARRSAFDILRRVEAESAFASVLLARLDPKLREDDRALCHELVLGVLRRKLWLDRAIEHFADRSLGKLDLSVRLALELGLYQLRFLSRIPSSAAVNESVKLVRASREQSAAGFVNAVLRRVTRELDYDPTSGVTERAEKLSIESSHPAWLIERWINWFGIDEATAFALADNETPSNAFRLTARANGEDVVDELRSAGGELSESNICPQAWRVKAESGVIRRLVEQGRIYMQDEASQLLAHTLNAQSADRVLDVTAAPGSKATHIAMLAPHALVIAGDVHAHRAKTMQRLADNQGVRIHAVLHDATTSLPFSTETFDRVLLDAPCSGTGTLRRNPEIRYRLNEEDIAELSQQQRLMMSHAASVVRRGGRLIYSTCSVEAAENEQVVSDFLSAHTEFVKVSPSVPAQLITNERYIRTWPHRDGCDGFFIACLERRN